MIIPTLWFISFVDCIYIRVCEHDNLKGECQLVNLEKCECVNFYYKNWANSIDTNGNCVNLFEGSNCRGESVFYRPNSGPTNFGHYGWDKEVASVRECLSTAGIRHKRYTNRTITLRE